MPEPQPFSEDELAEWLALPELALGGEVGRITGPHATHYRAILEIPHSEEGSAGDPERLFEPNLEGETITWAE